MIFIHYPNKIKERLCYMKKNFHSMVACLTVASLLLSNAVIVASAAQPTEPSAYTATETSGETSGDFEYSKYGSDSAKITKYNGTASELVIPEEINGLKIIAISYKAFADCTSLQKLTIANTVETIDAAAFEGCTALRACSVSSQNNTNKRNREHLKGIMKKSFSVFPKPTAFV